MGLLLVRKGRELSIAEASSTPRNSSFSMFSWLHSRMKSSIAIVFCLLILGVDSKRRFQFMKEAGQGRLKGWGQEVVFVSFKNLLEGLGI